MFPALLFATGPLPIVNFTLCKAKGLHVELAFDPCLDASKASPDDVVHIYAVEPQVEVCLLMTSVERQAGQASFELPDLSDETSGKGKATFYLYAIVEAANTAQIPTLSADEKRQHKTHRNINRRVSPSVHIGTIRA